MEIPPGLRPPRSPGLHLSDLIDVKWAFLTGQSFNGPIHPLRAEQGYLWEEALERALADRFSPRPAEIMCEGVAMSPDGIDWEPDGPVVVDYKCTSKSSARGLDERWLIQLKGYCYGLKTLRARSIPFHFMGDYGSKPPVPECWCHNIWFTETELVEEWQSLLLHGREAGLR